MGNETGAFSSFVRRPYPPDTLAAFVDWAEKHRPKSVKDVVGNPTAIAELKRWAESWKKKLPEKKAVVLSGPPGIGKTSAALALAADMGWGVVEMNASDKRNAEAVQKVALQGATTSTFALTGEFLNAREGERTLIILDEADNLFGREDFGGVGAIVDTIRQARQPLILICNDYYELSRRSGAIKSLAKQIRWQRLTPAAVKTALKRVAAAENVSLPEDALDAIAEHAGGDLRSALNDLQAIAEGRKQVSAADVRMLGNRDVEGDVWAAVREILQSGSGERARRAAANLDEDPESLILWIDENLPYEYRDPADLARGYERLARADTYLRRARRTQVYRFWSYATEMMTAGVATARRGRWAGGQYRFPLWLMKRSRTRGLRATMESVSRKIGGGVHASWRRTWLDVLPAFKELFRKDPGFRSAMAAEFRFSEKELAYLLDADEDSKEVRELVQVGGEAEKPGRRALARFDEEGS